MLTIMLNKNFSRQNDDVFFLIFPRKQAFTFHAHSLQTICVEYQSLFSRGKGHRKRICINCQANILDFWENKKKKTSIYC